MRILKHLFSGPWQVHRHFPKAAMQRIQAEIEKSESLHFGELRFAVEAGLHWRALLRQITSRQRAVEVFSQLHIWDTEHNTGVLIYLLLADRQVEIVADRGIHAKVGDQVWNGICHAMEAHFRQGRFEQGVIEGVQAINAQLQCHFPADLTANPNELPDAPVVL
jgi:uncharacterized membrane protein